MGGQQPWKSSSFSRLRFWSRYIWTRVSQKPRSQPAPLQASLLLNHSLLTFTPIWLFRIYPLRDNNSYIIAILFKYTNLIDIYQCSKQNTCYEWTERCSEVKCEISGLSGNSATMFSNNSDKQNLLNGIINHIPVKWYFDCAPRGIRIPVLALRGLRPGPLDDGGI